MIAALLVHVVVALAAPSVARRYGRLVFAWCALAPVGTLVWAAAIAADVVDGRVVTEHVSWVRQLGLSLDLRLDAFGLLMVFLIAGVGALVLAYAHRYFSDDPRLGRFAATLSVFAASMLGVVLSDNLLLLYVFWELTSVTSYLLIGYDDEKAAPRGAALQALLVTGAGGLAMLAGFVLIGQAAGTYSLSEIVAAPPSGTAVGVGLALVLVGAFTKSAQAPFHFWLPGAMSAPTPVSAYLHSATMVKAGVYVLARFAPAFAGANDLWRPVVVTVGVVTMVLGGLRALRRHDAKLLLADSTVSQLGFMVALVGAGRPELTAAGVAVLLAHGIFKAALFMVVGVVDHQAHTRDIRRLSGLGARMPVAFAVAAVAGASMAGLPPLAGFVAKEKAYEALLHVEGAGGTAALVGIVVGSVLTAAYTARFVWGAFGRKPAHLVVDPVGEHVDRPRPSFVMPAAVLAATTVALGVVPGTVGPLVNAAARALDPSVEPGTLYLWHGVNTALILSAITLAAGFAAFVLRVPVERVQGSVPRIPSAADAYTASVRLLNRGARAVTGVVQNGSLPIYLAVIMLTLVVVPGSALVSAAAVPDGLRVVDTPLQIPAAIVIVVAALAAAVVRRRFAAVLLLGAVGYGVAVLFVIQGAPDLALTQFLIETLAVVVFMLVLRQLPARFDAPTWPTGRLLRLGVAGAVGVFVTTFTLAAVSSRSAPPVSQDFAARAVDEAGGRNIVNVILVDFRGFDTFGEIAVLAVAALGVFSLLRSRREPDRPRRMGP